MKINVAMPQLGESVSEGEVIRWLKKAGDAVRRDEALVEVKTDKATVEIPAPSSGTLSEILVEAGGTVQVGANIATIESTSEAAALAVEGAPASARKIEPTVTRAEKAPAKPALRAAARPPDKPATSLPAGRVAGPARRAAAPAREPQANPQPAQKQAAEAATAQPPKPAAKAPARQAAAQPKPSQQAAPRRQMTSLARRIAGEFGLDLSKIRGTGEAGKITREDVLNARKTQANAAPAAAEAPEVAKVEEGAKESPETEGRATPESAASLPAGRVAGPADKSAESPAKETAEAPEVAAAREATEEAAETAPAATPEPAILPAGKPAEPPAPSAAGEDEVVALSPIRRRIAARLVQSSRTIPRVTTAIETDMTALAELRKQHRESYEKAGVKLSYMPFIMKATIEALKATPPVNASWGGENLILHKRVHLGVAVSVEGGLVVPVIRNADEMSIRQLAEKLGEVADHARAGKLAADEVRGSTFTITNPGLFGTIYSTPLINPPEAAILAVCRIAETPVAREGKIVIRQMMNLALSYDHRIIDGETALQFLQHIRAALEAAKFEMA